VLTDSTGRERPLNVAQAIWTIRQLDTEPHVDSTESCSQAGRALGAGRHAHLSTHHFVAVPAGFCTDFGSTVISARRLATSGVIVS
jgi:hypothetical protein